MLREDFISRYIHDWTGTDSWSRIVTPYSMPGITLYQISHNTPMYANYMLWSERPLDAVMHAKEQFYRGRWGVNRIRKFLSGASSVQSSLTRGGDQLPCHRTLYKKSTMTSFSMIPILLKCFRTAFASCSLLCLRSCLCRAIVGDIRPIGEVDRTSWLYCLLNAAGVFKR